MLLYWLQLRHIPHNDRDLIVCYTEEQTILYPLYFDTGIRADVTTKLPYHSVARKFADGNVRVLSTCK